MSSTQATARPNTGTGIFPNQILSIILSIIRTEWEFTDWYPSLLSLSLVNSNLRPLAQKHLFRTIILDFCTKVNNITNFHQVLKSNKNIKTYVETLKVVSLNNQDEEDPECDLGEGDDYLDHFAECRADQEYILSLIISTLASKGGSLKELQLLLQSNPKHFDDYQFDWCRLINSLQQAIRKAFVSRPHLNSLVVVNAANVPIDYLFHPNLKSLTLVDTSFAPSNAYNLPSNVTTNLKTLDLSSPHGTGVTIGDFTKSVLEARVTGLDNLDSLSVALFPHDPSFMNDLKALVTKVTTGLKTLRIRVDPELAIPHIDFLESCSQLNTLTFSLDLNLVGPLSFNDTNPFSALTKLKTPSSLKTLSIEFRSQGFDSPINQAEFTSWAKDALPALDKILSKPQWTTLQNLEIVFCAERKKNRGLLSFGIPKGSMGKTRKRGIKIDVSTKTFDETNAFSIIEIEERVECKPANDMPAFPWF